MKAHLQNLESEAAKLRELNEEAAAKADAEAATEEDKASADARSVYVGNVRGATLVSELHEEQS
jgi:hypothetical protein